MFKNTLYILATALLFVSCSESKKNPELKSNDNVSVEEEFSSIEFNPSEYKSQDIVFYNLFSPVDLTYLVQKSSSYYNSSLINPLNNITNYTNSVQLALNLGVYGADFSYLTMFKQSQQAYSYMSAIQRVSEELGIPQDYVNIDSLKEQYNSGDFTKLNDLARNTYNDIDKYLKETGREHIADLVLLGGWVETLNIAINMHESPDSNLISRIAMQQFSLNNIINLMLNYNDKYEVTEYIILLKKLKQTFDNCQIAFNKGSLKIDTVSRRIMLAPGHSVTISDEKLEEIRKSTNRLRRFIVDQK